MIKDKFKDISKRDIKADFIFFNVAIITLIIILFHQHDRIKHLESENKMLQATVDEFNLNSDNHAEDIQKETEMNEAVKEQQRSDAISGHEKFKEYQEYLKEKEKGR